jgi:hypothetical protein|tara:strand:+ start:1345 stop:1515 length:171 start_codon:yes stop_codon:yes gene_type:complete
MKKETMTAKQWKRYLELDQIDLAYYLTDEETKELGEMNRKYMNPDGTLRRESDTHT